MGADHGPDMSMTSKLLVFDIITFDFVVVGAVAVVCMALFR